MEVARSPVLQREVKAGGAQGRLAGALGPEEQAKAPLPPFPSHFSPESAVFQPHMA